MCIIFIAYKVIPEAPLLILANRDEFFSRPTKALHHWPPENKIIAGKDLSAGGTWMGATTGRRFSALTNVRNHDKNNPEARSRGTLVSDYLLGQLPAETYLNQVLFQSSEYNPFNLLAGDENSLWYLHSPNSEVRELSPGIHAICNGSPHDQWPKMQLGKQHLAQLVANDLWKKESEILSVLRNEILAKRSWLPKTGLEDELEHWLSSIFITPKHTEKGYYGTRSSSILSLSQGQLKFTEYIWTENKELAARKEIYIPRKE